MASPEQGVATDRQPGITIGQIFLDRVLFEHRLEALSLPPNTPAKVGDVTVQVEIGVGPSSAFGFTRVTVSTRPENEPVYNVLVRMTGIFAPEPGVSGMPLETFLQNNSVALLYPFVREAFANVTQRGRFGPIWLSPFNTRSAPWKEMPKPEDHEE